MRAEAAMIKSKLEHSAKKMGQDQCLETKAVNSTRAPEFFYVEPSVWPWCEDGGLQKPLRTEKQSKFLYVYGTDFIIGHIIVTNIEALYIFSKLLIDLYMFPMWDKYFADN